MAIDREVVAHHEAGHAVVAKFFQVTIDRITIVADGDAAGHVIHSYGCNIDELKNALDNDAEEAPMWQWVLEREAIIALAGGSAQRRFRPDSVDEEGGGGDRLQVHHVLDYLAGEEDQELRDAWEHVLLIRTKRLVDENWATIEGLASLLLKNSTIEGVENVKEAIADASLPEEHRGKKLSFSERLAILTQRRGNAS